MPGDAFQRQDGTWYVIDDTDQKKTRELGSREPQGLTPFTESAPLLKSVDPLDRLRAAENVDATEQVTGVIEEDQRSRNRRAAARLGLEIGVTGATALGTGGMGLGARLAAQGIAGFAASRASESFDPSDNPNKRALITGGAAVLGEGLFGAIAGAFKPTQFVKGGKEALDIVRGEGGKVTPGLVSANRGTDITEGILEQSFVGGQRIAKARQSGIDVSLGRLDDFAKKLRANAEPGETGTILVDAIEGKGNAFKSAAKGVFGSLDAQADGVLVDITGSKARILALTQEPLAPESIKDLAKTMNELPNQVSFADASLIRSRLLSATRSSTDIFSKDAVRASKELSGIVDREMVDAAKRFKNPALIAEWRAANKWYKKGAKEFESKLVKSMLREENPEVVYQNLIRGKRPSQIKRVRKLIDDEKKWGSVQAEFFDDLMRQSGLDTFADDASGQLAEVSGKKMLDIINRSGKDFLGAIYGPGKARIIRQNADVLRIMQDTAGKGLAGAITMRIMEVGAVISLAGGNVAAAGVFAVPSVLSRMWTNPLFGKLMIDGVKAPAGSPQAIRVAGQIAAMVARESGNLKDSGITDSPQFDPRTLEPVREVHR